MKFVNGVKKLAVLVLAVSFLGVSSASPVFANGEKYISATIHKGKKEYNQFPIVYSDDFFKKSACEYDSRLAAASLALEMSSFSASAGSDHDKDKKAKYSNVVEALEALEFDKIEANEDYDKDSTPDSIGVAVGSKKIQDDKNKEFTLIPVVIRGGGYDSEWAGNMKVGENGEVHQGFNSAADKVKSFVDGYISKKNISGPVKLWIVGYSRAGAVAGLVAYKYNQDLRKPEDINKSKINIVTLDSNDIYAYTFEAPNSILKEALGKVEQQGQDDDFEVVYSANEINNNIHNIVDDSDAVTKVAPMDWGFTKPGQIHKVNLSEDEKQKKQAIINNYVANMRCNDKTLDESKKNVIDNGNSTKGFLATLNRQSDYVQATNELISFLSSAIERAAKDANMDARTYYAQNLQSVFTKFLSILSKKYKYNGGYDRFLDKLKENENIKSFMELGKKSLLEKGFVGLCSAARNAWSDSLSKELIEHAIGCFNDAFGSDESLKITEQEKSSFLEFFNGYLNKNANIMYLLFVGANGKEFVLKHEPAVHLASLISSIKDLKFVEAYDEKLKNMVADYRENGASANIYNDYLDCYCIDKLLSDSDENSKKIVQKYRDRKNIGNIKDAAEKWYNIYKDSLQNYFNKISGMKKSTDVQKLMESISKLQGEETLRKIAEFKAFYEDYKNVYANYQNNEYMHFETVDDFAQYKICALKKDEENKKGYVQYFWSEAKKWANPFSWGLGSK